MARRGGCDKTMQRFFLLGKLAGRGLFYEHRPTCTGTFFIVQQKCGGFASKLSEKMLKEAGMRACAPGASGGRALPPADVHRLQVRGHLDHLQQSEQYG